jgi:hypothetical protein
MLRAVLVAVAAVAAAIAATASADVPPFTECSVTNTTTSGGVTQLVSTKAWVTSRYIGTPVTLKRGDTVCTNASGQLWWKLSASKTKTVMCNTGPGGSLRVFPPSFPTQVVRFKRGVSVCSVTGAGSVQFAVDGTALAIRFADPVFAVETDPEKGTMVKLVQGFAEVTGEGGGRSVVVVGPGQQTFVGAHGDPEQPATMQLDARETAAAATLRRNGPQPSFARPAVGGSPTLRAIYERRVIRVAVDSDGLSEQDLAFVRGYFSSLATSWKLKLDLTAVPGVEALKTLTARGADAVVTALDVSAQAGLNASPFLAAPDQDGVLQLVLPEDAGYGEAMADWLQERLFFGRYGDLFRSSFQGAEAEYDPLRAVLP